jgi:hypothetical protein
MVSKNKRFDVKDATPTVFKGKLIILHNYRDIGYPVAFNSIPERVVVDVLADVSHFRKAGQAFIKCSERRSQGGGYVRTLGTQFHSAPQTAKCHDEKLQIGMPAEDKFFILRLGRPKASVLKRGSKYCLVAKRLRTLQDHGI